MLSNHRTVTGAVVSGLASIPVLLNLPPVADASQRALGPLHALADAPFAFRISGRRYAIGRRTLNVFIGPPNCMSGIGIAFGLRGGHSVTQSGTSCNSDDIVRFTTAGNPIAYTLPAESAVPGYIIEDASATHMWFNLKSGGDRLDVITTVSMRTFSEQVRGA